MFPSLILIATEAPNGNMLPGDIREFWWLTAAFLVVVSLIVKLAGPAIMAALNGRTERIQSEFDEARDAKTEAENALSAASSDLPDVATETSAIQAEAETTAAQLKVDIVARANVEAEEMKAKALVEIENQSRQAIADLRGEVAGLTRAATHEVVASELDASAHSDLIDSYINKIGTIA